jgi:CheY-like chemotaxis protein
MSLPGAGSGPARRGDSPFEHAGEEGFLSGDEIRELLGADAGGVEPERAPGIDPAVPGERTRSRPRVLIVSRRKADVDLLKACLEAAGAVPALARNPFTALDRVRADEPDLVVSDLDLWANHGALLLQRLQGLPRRPPLLFVADRARSAGLKERAEEAGAAGILLRPLRPGEVEDRLGGLLRARDGGLAGAAARPVSGGGREAGGDRGSGAGPAELAWLRFFHRASRLARVDAPRAERARALARCALDGLGPRAAAVIYRERGRAAGVIEAAEGLEPDALLAAVGAAPAGGARLRVDFGEPGQGGCLVLGGLAPAIADGGEAYLDDVRHLAASVLA